LKSAHALLFILDERKPVVYFQLIPHETNEHVKKMLKKIGKIQYLMSTLFGRS
jgi:hypothetical protein